MAIEDPLALERVLQFAADELGATIGLDFPGRVFVAGGAFKTLIHGRPPRDLDLWAPSPEDRARLVERLELRGAIARPRHAYSDVYYIAGRELEIPDRTEPDTLEARLRRFDIGLSAVGVESSHGSLGAVVDPVARASVEHRSVFLLKPLANPRHVLSTIARARRYADELGWSVPETDESLAWSVFDAADADEQTRLLERYERAALPGWGVREEAERRRK